ncbi:MAG: hypothetical protein K2J18_05710, partial [Paramuribaculum sp.]|nr:hypothetical protein [Paramuribaculum sp.]
RGSLVQAHPEAPDRRIVLLVAAAILFYVDPLYAIAVDVNNFRVRCNVAAISCPCIGLFHKISLYLLSGSAYLPLT